MSNQGVIAERKLSLIGSCILLSVTIIQIVLLMCMASYRQGQSPVPCPGKLAVYTVQLTQGQMPA